MKHTDTLLDVCLTLFDGAAAGDAGGAAPAAESAPAAAPQAETKSGTSRRNASSGELANVRYGKQPDAPAPDARGAQEEAKPQDNAEDRQARFDELIRGEFRDLYDARVQGIVKDRLAKVGRAAQERMDAVAPVLEMVAARYGVAPDDAEALRKAIEQDDTYWEQAAEDAGMSVEQYRQYQRMERENAQFKRVLEAQREQQGRDAILQRWNEQAEQLKTVYPGFDLNQACTENPRFIELLKNNVDMQTAYEVTHMDEIKNGIAAQTAHQTEQNVTRNIQAKGMRPPENGAGGAASAVVFKTDVSKLTRADRAEIAKRVARGERITF